MNNSHLCIDNPLLKPFESFQSPALDFASHISDYQIATGVTSALESIGKVLTSPIYEKIGSFANRFGEIIHNNLSPAIQWLQSIDYNPIITFLQNIDFDVDISKRYKELNKAYLQAMFDCNWFPYAGWSTDISLFTEVNDILSTSRGISKRCINRVNKAIFTYYTDSKIRNIKRSWKSSDLEPHIKKILCQAIEAYRRREYALTISCLATMWEGWLKDKMPIKKRTTEEYKSDVKELVVENGYEEIVGDFYNKLIIKTCYSVEETNVDIPNRHGVAHSWYRKYPNKKASLNAILLTDFIINLKPIEQLEE